MKRHFEVLEHYYMNVELIDVLSAYGCCVCCRSNKQVKEKLAFHSCKWLAF